VRSLAVVDIDGVVADVRHRLRYVRRKPKAWDAFFAAADADQPHPEGLDLVAALAADHEVVFLSGRPEHLRAATQRWLERHGLGGHRLELRGEADRRPAAAVKLQRLRVLARDRDVAVVIDDDPLVVRRLRGAGYPVRVADWEQRPAAGDRALFEAQELEGGS
jgi:uncharacterized HAD superfamily protein